jgi:hypothetical protein
LRYEFVSFPNFSADELSSPFLFLPMDLEDGQQTGVKKICIIVLPLAKPADLNGGHTSTPLSRDHYGLGQNKIESAYPTFFRTWIVF